MTKNEFWNYCKKNDLYDLFSESDCSICNKHKMCLNIPTKEWDHDYFHTEIEHESICKKCFVGE